MIRPNVSDLSLKEKISQLLMVWGTSLMYDNSSGQNTLRSKQEMAELMEKYQYGSLWANVHSKVDFVTLDEKIDGKRPTTNEFNAWISEISQGVRLPMLVGMDSERGAGRSFSDAAEFSSALAIGAANSEELTYQLTAGDARQIKAAGVNWIWGPVVDGHNRFASISVGRSYSDDHERLIRLATAAVHGMQSEKVAATAKHFPGNDPYEYRDSHIVTTKMNLTVEEWMQTEAKPFQALIDAGVMSIMVGHLAFPDADDEMLNGNYIPATMSSKIIQGILREKMGFDGVVITDGITMGGLVSICSHEEMLIRMINAGNDILLGVGVHDFDIVYQAVCEGRISMKRIDESCERVLAMKEKLGLFEKSQEPIDIIKENTYVREINKQIAEKSITLVCDKNDLLPINRNAIKRVTIVCSSHVPETEKELEVMKKEFENHGATVKITSEVVRVQNVKQLAEENDLIVYAAQLSAHQPIGLPSLYGNTLFTYCNAFSVGKEKSIGVSMGYPYLYYDIMQGANTYFNIYNTAPENQVAFVKALYGEIPCCTSSPIDITPKRRIVYC